MRFRVTREAAHAVEERIPSEVHAMVRRWLVKTDPRLLSFEDLLEARRVTWRGVTQPLSLRHLRAMRRGDEVLVYHAGAQRAVVGGAKVRKGAYPDPQAPALAAVDLTIGEPLPRPVTRRELSEVPALSGWELVRIPRIHVAPVPAVAWRTVHRIART